MERQSKKTKNVFCLQASKKRGKTMQNMSMIFISETNIFLLDKYIFYFAFKILF